MQKIIRFWNKDFVNKLIILLVLLIVGAILGDLVLIATRESARASLLADLFPTPTLPLGVILTQGAATAEYKSAMATASVPPTMTTRPFTPKPWTATPSFTATLAPTETPSVVITTTQTATLPLTVPTEGTIAPSTGTPKAGKACPPAGPGQAAKVVEILDGATIKVLMDGLVYSVRYIGIQPPTENGFPMLAKNTNGDLVFRQDVMLYSDAQDKDQVGRLLRYVMVGEKMANLELVTLGLASVDGSTSFSCSQDFKNAEQIARTAKLGMWQLAQAP